MVASKTLIVSLLLSQLILLHAAQAQQQVNNRFGGEKKRGLVIVEEKIECGAACKTRCQLSSRPNLCKRACGSCCVLCGCVPPGTSGHQDVCPCYFNQTTHDHKPKCP